MDLKMPANQTATKPNESAAAARQMDFGSRFLYSQDLARLAPPRPDTGWRG
jgi:hypothetical protein